MPPKSFRILLNPDQGEGGAAPAAPANPPKTKDDAAERYQKLLDKHNGDAGQLALRLHKDNFRQREEIRDLKGKLPASDAVILTADEAKAWNAYKELGSPEEFKSARTERDDFQRRLASRERADLHREAAEELRYRPSVLSTLLDQHKLELRIQPAKDSKGEPVLKDGKPTREVLVQVANEADPAKPKTVPLAEYAKQHWSDFLPSLEIHGEPPRAIGTPFTAQGSSSKPSERSEEPRRSLVY